MVRNYRKFNKSQRSTFSYWFWHWLAFQDVAREYHLWKFHHIFHDIEKPFLRLFLPYEKVQKLHRYHRNHHLEYPGKKNWVDLFIDWECSNRTKLASPLHAIDEASKLLHEGKMSVDDFNEFMKVAHSILQRNL